MSDNNGWPGKPGVPLSPERDGAHRLRHLESGLERDALWACGGTWLDVDGSFSIPHAAAFYAYLGPCLTPAEVDARVAQARREEREASAARALTALKKCGSGAEPWVHRAVDTAIRALKGEGDD